MMQGGDPEGTGMGGSEEKIKGEFSANGVQNTLSHTRGAISMARNAVSYDSASSPVFSSSIRIRPSLTDSMPASDMSPPAMEIVDRICEETAGDGQKRHRAGRLPAGHCLDPRDRLNAEKERKLWFVTLGLVITAALFIAMGFVRSTTVTWKINKKQLFALVGVLLIGLSCYVSVPTGHTGVVTTFGSVENYTLEAGIHFKLPWQEIIKMDNRVQKSTQDMSCFSSDIQEVSMTYTVNYQISKQDAMTIYKTIGIGYYDTVIAPCITESVKIVTAQYTAEDLVSSRSLMASQIEGGPVPKKLGCLQYRAGRRFH